MPVFSCSGTQCERLISVSAIPGGNPTALAEPEKWAVVHRKCTACGARYCDRCVASSTQLTIGTCLGCGGALADPPAGEARRMILGQAPAGGAVAAAVVHPPSEEPPKPAKPWWKFW